jgi:hypothetical protein
MFGKKKAKAPAVPVLQTVTLSPAAKAMYEKTRAASDMVLLLGLAEARRTDGVSEDYALAVDRGQWVSVSSLEAVRNYEAQQKAAL